LITYPIYDRLRYIAVAQYNPDREPGFSLKEAAVTELILAIPAVWGNFIYSSSTTEVLNRYLI
jgi:hypothetical protein